MADLKSIVYRLLYCSLIPIEYNEEKEVIKYNGFNTNYDYTMIDSSKAKIIKPEQTDQYKPSNTISHAKTHSWTIFEMY